MIKKFIRWIKYRISHEWCYDRMEYDGIAAFGCCSGIFGGDRESNYLSYMCMDCPHLVLPKEVK